MSENIVNNTTNTTVLTEKEVFDQIVLLQKQLTENSPTSLHRLGEALYDARGEGEDAKLTDDQVSEICKVFAQREETLNQMLDFYKQMYNDLYKKNKKPALEGEELAACRKEYLEFVQKTVASAASYIGPSPIKLPDFDKLWKNVFLGE